jgi:hypothetical protein
MNRYLQEFFWTPSELVAWLRVMCKQLGLWIVVWPVGQDARAYDPDDIRPEMFEGVREDAVQIFVGAPEVSTGPAWRIVNGKQLLDFQASYAVQLVPSVVTPDGTILLQGRLAVLRPDQYENAGRAEKLVALFRRLQSSLEQESDADRCVVQLLSNGERKVWKGMLVGKAVKASNKQLKQFERGEVVFGVEAA